MGVGGWMCVCVCVSVNNITTIVHVYIYVQNHSTLLMYTYKQQHTREISTIHVCMYVTM